MALGPISVAVLDDGAHLVAFKREDGPGAALRPAIAIGKAWGAVGMGMPSRSWKNWRWSVPIWYRPWWRRRAVVWCR